MLTNVSYANIFLIFAFKKKRTKLHTFLSATSSSKPIPIPHPHPNINTYLHATKPKHATYHTTSTITQRHHTTSTTKKSHNAASKRDKREDVNISTLGFTAMIMYYPDASEIRPSFVRKFPVSGRRRIEGTLILDVWVFCLCIVFC
jgi:hypothetical protein